MSRSRGRASRKWRILLFGGGLIVLMLLAFALFPIGSESEEPYPFVRGLPFESVAFTSDDRTVVFRKSYEPDRECDAILTEANEYFGGKTGWKGENYKEWLACPATGWERYEPGHVGGYFYRKGSTTVSIWFWYKAIGDTRRAKEPPEVTIERTGSLIEWFRVKVYEVLHP